MLPKAIAFFLILFLPLALQGQENPDTLYAQADIYSQEGSFDQAYILYENASALYLDESAYLRYLQTRIEMAKVSQFTSVADRSMIPDIFSAIPDLLASGDLPKIEIATAQYYTTLGQYHRTITGNYPEALANFENAMSICDTLGSSADNQRLEILVERSQILANQERFNEAIADAQQGLELTQRLHGEQSAAVGPRYYNLGFIYYRKGHYQTAENLIKRGIEILISNNGPPMQIALGYNNLSAIFVAQMDLREAEENAIKFESIVKDILGPEHEAMGVLHWDMGQLYLNLQRHELAIETLSKAITIFENRFGSDYQQLPDLYHQLGAAYDGTSNCSEAEMYHEKGLSLKRRLFSGQPSKIIESYRYITQHYIDCNQPDQAKIFLDKSLPFRDSLDEGSLASSWLHELEGSYYFNQDSFLAGARAQHRALWTLAEKSAPSNLSENPDPESIFNTLYAAENSTKKSQALVAYWQQTEHPGDLSVTETNLKYADQLIDKLRSEYQSAESKIFLQQKARDHYDTSLDFAFNAWQKTRNFRFIEAAWNTSEKSRSLVLMEALKSQPASNFDIPEKIIQQQADLKDDISFLESSMLEAREYQDTQAIYSILERYSAKKEQFQTLANEIARDYPAYFELTTNLTPVSLKSLQTQLDDDDIFLEYFVGTESVYRFTIMGDTVHLTRLGHIDSLESDLNPWIALQQNVNSILERPSEIISETEYHAEKLYHFLFDGLQNLLSTPRDLIIVADQKLGYLSFDALVQPREQNADRYLIFDHSIRYAYSATQFAETIASLDFDAIQFAGFAPSYGDPDADVKNLLASRLYRDGNYNLPGARTEVMEIQQVLGGEIFTDDLATEGTFKQKVNRFDILHLSLHGVLNDVDPLYSKLVFAPDTLEDGFLNVHEIYPLDLQSDLVVLSACNTGQGTLAKGEGIMSLSRAFSYAGSPRMIASLWKADDATTSDIMVAFYKFLDSGLSVHQALRQAKLQFLSTSKVPTLRHPYFWSPFVLYDQHQSKKPKFSILKTLSAGILFLALIILVVRRFSKSDQEKA